MQESGTDLQRDARLLGITPIKMSLRLIEFERKRVIDPSGSRHMRGRDTNRPGMNHGSDSVAPPYQQTS